MSVVSKRSIRLESQDYEQSHCSTHSSLIKMLTLVSRLMPAAQLEHTLQYFGVYAETIDRLCSIVKAMPRLGDTVSGRELPVYLHYFTGVADYYICEYDGEDTMFGKVRFKAHYPAENGYQKFSLSNLKSNQFLELDFGWGLVQ